MTPAALTRPPRRLTDRVLDVAVAADVVPLLVCEAWLVREPVVDLSVLMVAPVPELLTVCGVVAQENPVAADAADTAFPAAVA
jgi:hypothetical protein